VNRTCHTGGAGGRR